MTSLPAEREFTVYAKPIGALCNLSCGYCNYLDKDRLFPGSTNLRMTGEVMEAMTTGALDAAPEGTVRFVWCGGEPTLLGVSFFEGVIRAQRSTGQAHRIRNEIRTNGTLIDPRWADFLKLHHWDVEVGLDGPPELHNRFRNAGSHAASFDATIAGIGHLNDAAVPFGTCTAVHKDNAEHGSDVYAALVMAGSRRIRIEPIVERLPSDVIGKSRFVDPPAGDNQRQAGDVPNWCVSPAAYGSFLIQVFDCWIRHGMDRVSIPLFESMVEAKAGHEPSLCWLKPRCGNRPTVEHTGDAFACDSYVFSRWRTGNLLEIPLRSAMSSERHVRLMNDKHDRLPPECLQCAFLSLCRGECPRRRFSPSTDGNGSLNYLCEGYLKFFRHAEPALKAMATLVHAGRPISELAALLNRDRPAS